MIQFELITTRETKAMLDKFPAKTRAALVDAMTLSAKFLEGETKKSFGRVSGYPRVRTGNLRKSIYSKAYERASEVIGMIGTQVIYGRFLEEGTRKMKPYPFLRPTVTKNESKLSEFITDHIAKELNK